MVRNRLGIAAASTAMAVALLSGLAAPARGQQQPPAGPTRAEADRLAERIVARMTIAEKLPQLLNVAPAIPRLNIPAYNWWTESLHGAI